MDGFSVGAACYRATELAAQVACSAVSGVSSSGVLACENPSISGHTLTYTLLSDSVSGRQTRLVSVELQPCTPFDLAEYGPTVGAWFLALVAILSVRLAYTRVFGSGLPA